MQQQETTVRHAYILCTKWENYTRMTFFCVFTQRAGYRQTRRFSATKPKKGIPRTPMNGGRRTRYRMKYCVFSDALLFMHTVSEFRSHLQ